MENTIDCPPVLFIVFNRPELTQRVFACIRESRPAKLFVAADGPRPYRPSEEQLCAEARKVVAQVDWSCEVLSLFRDENLGCRRAVSTAIDWFFTHVPEGIILEDDCLPHPLFFRFCEELLEKYRDDERVMQIGGCNFQDGIKRGDGSYYFSIYNHIWGWASWRRAWKHYDRDMSLWPVLRGTDWLLNIGSGSKAFQQYWTTIFDTVHSGKIDTWDYQWTFSCWALSGLTILPARNLVTNVGFGEGATHTKDNGGAHANLPLEALEFPLSHPSSMVRNFAADKLSDRHVFGIGEEAHWKKAIRKIPAVNIVLRMLRRIR